MIQVTVAEAQKRLPELLALVETGESVEIHPESGESFVLVHSQAQAQARQRRRGVAGLPQGGKSQGQDLDVGRL